MKKSSLILTVIAVGLVAGCSREEPKEGSAAAATLPPARVRIDTVRETRAPAMVEVMGTIRPARRAMIAAKVMGSIDEMPVALGQRVHEGDLLVSISASEINAKVLQAKSQLNLARRDLERERDLLPKGASTAEMVRALEDRYTMTEAMVREAEAMLAYTRIKAPFDGVVARKMANAGDLAAPGYPLLEVEGTSDFQVEAGIPESLVPGLAIGTRISVELPETGAIVEGSLVELSSAADSYARTVLAKVALPPSANVRSGQFARVQVPGSQVGMLLAPDSCVTRLGQMERVFVDRNNRAVLRLVKTGARHGESVELLSGVDAGDRVVVNPPVGLVEGQALEVTP